MMLCKFMHFLPVHPLFVMCHLFSMPHALLCHKMLNTVLQTLVEIFIFSKKSWKMRKKEEICIKIYPKHVFLSLHHMLVKGFIPRKKQVFSCFQFFCSSDFLQNFAANFLLFSFFQLFLLKLKTSTSFWCAQHNMLWGHRLCMMSFLKDPKVILITKLIL